MVFYLKYLTIRLNELGKGPTKSMLFLSSVTYKAFWTHICFYISNGAAQQTLMSPCFILKIQALTHQELWTNAVKHQQKWDELSLGVAHYSLHADDLNTFHLIRLSHMICDPHGPKQNGGYCWLYIKIQTRHDCNFKHYKIILAALHVTKWPESC